MSVRVEGWMHALTAHPDRHVGSAGNLAATALVAQRFAAAGFKVARTTFECVEWEYGTSAINTGGERFVVETGPYSLPIDTRTELIGVTCIEDLESESVRGKVVLLHGDIARAQIMPKNFTFYNPDSHRRIVRALESFAPAAVVAATGRDPEMVGSQYPFPLFEDGDLDIPNGYMTDVDGARLLAHAGETVSLRIDSRRVPATAEHVVATMAGEAPGRIVVFAHIDSRKDSPGALDNASGVAVLLGVAELLADYGSGPAIEIVPLNGEDNYANPGEMLWVAANEGRMDDIILGINIDDAGLRDADTHVSLYGVPADIERIVRDATSAHAGFAEGPQWFQSDHAILGIYGRPAIALATADIAGFMARYAHSERDTIDLADPEKIADAARFVHDVVGRVAAVSPRS